jgi:predicted exporter
LLARFGRVRYAYPPVRFYGSGGKDLQRQPLNFLKPAPGQSEPSVRAVFLIKPRIPANISHWRKGQIFATLFRQIEIAIAESSLAEQTSLIGELKNFMMQEAMLQRDLSVTAAIAAILVFGVLIWFLRSLWQSILCFIPLTAALGAALCINLRVFGELNALALAFPPILIGIGIDYCIHLVNTGSQLLRPGRPPEVVLLRLYHAQLRPVILGAVTTSLAFASMAFGAMGGLKQVALLGGGGILLCLGSVMVFLPALLFSGGTLHVRPRPFRPHPLRFRRAAAVGVISLLSLGSAAFLRLRHDPSPRTVRNPNEKAFQYYDALSEELGVVPEPLILVAVNEEQFRKAREAVPRVLAGPSGLFRPALSLPFVQRAVPYIVAAQNWSQVAALLRNPRRRGAGVHRLELMDDWVYLRLQRNSRHPPVDLWMTVLFPTGDPLGEEKLEAVSAAAERFRELSGGARVTGLPIYYHHLLEILKRDAVGVGFTALAAAIAVLWIGFRTPLAAVASLLPSACALVWLLGFMALVGMPLNVLNVMAIPLIVGLGVDDGVHLVHRRLRGGSGSLVIQPIAGAVLLTTVTTVAGFISLVAAENPALRSMGYVGALGLLSAMALTIWVLPAIAEKLLHPHRSFPAADG